MTRLKAFQIDTVDLGNDPNIDTSSKIAWRGEWVDATYVLNDLVRDGNWTMIASTTTTDRAAPQPNGDPSTDPVVDTIWSVNDTHTGIVEMRHKYITTTPGWLQSLRVRTPFFDNDVVSKITLVNNTVGTVNIISNPILINDDWTTLRVDNYPLPLGTDFELWFEYYNSNDAAGVDGGWTSSQNTGEATGAQIRIDNLGTPSTLSISHTDLDSDNRSTELDGVIVGSIINIHETNDTKRSVELIVDAVDLVPTSSTGYTVSVIQNGTDNVRDGRTVTVSIDIPITQASPFNYNTDYWLSSPAPWATVTSELYFSGVLQADTNDAYGIELTFQEAYVSPDWELVATSSLGTTSSAAGGDTWNIVQLTGPITHPASTSEDMLVVDTTGGNVTIDLHAASLPRPRQLNIKRVDGSANTLTINGIAGSPGETIDGQSSTTLTSQYDNLTIMNDGTVWHVL